MNKRNLTIGYYRPTESFKSIPEHIAIMFEDDQTLVALVGPSDDDPDNLAETNRLAELFASAPKQVERILDLETRIENIIYNLEDLKKRPDDMMILGTALSIAKNYRKQDGAS